LRDCGGGGGGAGGPGTDGQEGIPGAGGDARTISDIPYYSEMDFSPGGMGSDILTRALTIDDAAVISPEYGSGGDAGISTNDNASWSSTPDDILAGAAGKAGVVIVWWEYAGAL
jgi:hypothetical protein